MFFSINCLSQFYEKKTYKIQRVNNLIKIDGKLNEKIWSNLPLAKNFVQINPNNGQKERDRQKTEVRICYNDQSIFFGVIMYDNAPDSILKELSKRDEENKNFDAFNIFIDPFNNGQVEYNFSVTAAGVQIDRKFSKTGIDKNWDAVWKSEVKITDFGWIAEIEIPFSQFRFSNENNEWGLNMSRSIRRFREDYSWNPINIKYNDYALQAGRLVNFKNINSPIRLSFMPYASLYLEKYKTDVNIPYNYGLDLKYGINKSFTLDMTLIPDFGQVSSDDMVLNLSPFEIKYDEKRQFFNEGIELFNKGQDMFYSRRLQNDLINATKITGRTKKGYGVALLNAITNKNDDNPLTNYNATILDKTFGNSSSFSIMNTNMVKMNNEKTANVTGVFTRINNKDNSRVYVGELKLSQEYFSSERTLGYSGKFAIGSSNGNFQYDLYTFFKDDKYNPNDFGFSYSNNEIINGLELRYKQFNKSEKLIDFATSIEAEYKTLFTDQNFVSLEVESETKATLKNYTTIFFRCKISPFETNDYYEARSNNLLNPVKKSKSFYFGSWISTDYRKKIALDISGGISTSPLYQGNTFRWRISPRYRVSNRFSLKYVLSVRNQINDIGFITNDTLGFFVNPPIVDVIFAKRNTYMITNVFSGTYVISNKLDFSFKLRYHTDQVENLNFKEVDNKGYLINTNDNVILDDYNINYYTWTSDLSLNWWFAPGSQMSVVWKNGIDNETNNIQNSWLNNLEETFNMKQQNSLSVKIVYYLDYLYFKK